MRWGYCLDGFGICSACFVYVFWMFWILFGSQVPLATHDQMHTKLNEKGKDMQEYLGRLRALDLVISFFLIVEWVIKALCYGWFATLTRVEERIRMVLLIPVAL